MFPKIMYSHKLILYSSGVAFTDLLMIKFPHSVNERIETLVNFILFASLKYIKPCTFQRLSINKSFTHLISNGFVVFDVAFHLRKCYIQSNQPCSGTLKD